MTDEAEAAGEGGGAHDPPPMPFSFKLTLILGALYVGWRIIQAILCIPSFFGGVDCPFL